jgi:hypothetical protein
MAGAVPPLAQAVLRVIEEESERVTEAYDEACRKVRSA